MLRRNSCAMDAYQCIVTKREFRSFTADPIPADLLQKVLNAGRMSGSSRNRQPWHFVVLQDRARLRQFATFGRFAQHVAAAAAAIAVIVDEPSHAFDAGRCAQNVMLAAWNFGIATCPATTHHAAEAKRFLGVPEDKTIAVTISLGYPDPRGRRVIERAALRILAGRGRRPFESMVSRERYQPT